MIPSIGMTAAISAATADYADGQFMIGLLPYINNMYWQSVDFGATWVKNSILPPSGGKWGLVAISSNGKYVSLYCPEYGYVYYSSDYGVTFAVSQAGIYMAENLAMTPNGQYQCLSTSSAAYYSTNFGQTWQQSNGLTGSSFSFITMTGNNEVYIGSSGSLFMSTNGGASFSAMSTTPSYGGNAMLLTSESRQNFYKIGSSLLMFSTNYGSSFSQVYATPQLSAVNDYAISDNYRNYVATSQYIYKGIGSMTNLTTTSAGSGYGRIVCSKNGQYVLASKIQGSGSPLILSSDYGSTWVTKNANYNFIDIAMNRI